MSWKFLNIGKANAEIERLELEVAKVSKERDEARTALESNASETVKAAEQLQTESAATIETLTGQVNGLTAELSKAKSELTAANAKVAALPTQISAEAQRITAAQGQAPVIVPAAEAGAPGGGDVIAELQAISDPVKRSEFFNQNKAAILAARRK